MFAWDGVRVVVETARADAPVDEHEMVGRFTGRSFAVTDIEDEHARLLARGVRFCGAPEKQFGGWLAGHALRPRRQ